MLEGLIISFDGIEETATDLDRVAAAMLDTAPPLALAGKVVADSTAERFKTAGADVGGWAPIAERSRKQRIGNQGAPPLIDTEALMRAATSQQDGAEFARPDGLERTSIYRIKPDGLEMGVEAVDARAHQEGTETEPARPFMVITDNDEAEIEAEFDGYYDRVIGE